MMYLRSTESFKLHKLESVCERMHTCKWLECSKGPQNLELITIAFFLTFTFSCFNANLFVVLLKSCKVLASFTELTLLHALTDIPMHECTLGVHEVELVVNAREDFCNGGGVADHAACAHDLRQITTWNHCWRLIVNSTLESCGTPVHELDGALCLDSGH